MDSVAHLSSDVAKGGGLSLKDVMSAGAMSE